MSADIGDTVDRIGQYERMLDRSASAAAALETALDAFEAVQDDLARLEAYYTGPDWRADFEADEAGLLPAGLKRGVLSEDGIDHLLDRVRALRERMCEQSAAAPSDATGSGGMSCCSFST